MHLHTFQSLLTPPGQAAIQAAAARQPREENFLPVFTELSRRFPGDLARAALEIAILRREAINKFTNADRLYFTREALEQASAETVAAYRAQRFQPFPLLLDLACSIGADTLQLARLATGKPVVGVDMDGLRLAMAGANLAALNLAEACLLVQADLRLPLPVFPSANSSQMGIFFDPGRRVAGKRVFSVRDYQPPLGVIQEWLPRYPALGVKISPGVHLDELAAYDAEVEFISLAGELKEAVLWFGPLKTAQRRSTILPGAYSLVSGESLSRAPTPRLSQPRAYLYEPDPAILRAGQVRQLAEQIDAYQLDEDIAYLTTDHFRPTPFGRAWPVEDWFPFNLKRLRSTLRARSVTEVVVKKRGSPLEPDALLRSLRLKSPAAGSAVARVVFLTHLQGQPIAILCYPEITAQLS